MQFVSSSHSHGCELHVNLQYIFSTYSHGCELHVNLQFIFSTYSHGCELDVNLQFIFSTYSHGCELDVNLQFISSTYSNGCELHVNLQFYLFCLSSWLSILFYSVQGCVLSLQEVALHQSPPSFSVVCYRCPYHSLLLHNVSSPTTFCLPTDLTPVICHFVLLIVHLLSFIRAMCPAHFHGQMQYLPLQFIHMAVCNTKN